MTLVITWEHIGVLAAVLTVIVMIIGWFINRFDAAQDKARAELLETITEKNNEQDRSRLALREAINERSIQQLREQEGIRKSLEAAWTKIDKLIVESVARDDFERSRAERIEADSKLRAEFKEDIDRLGIRLESAIERLGSRLDAVVKSSNGGRS